MFEDAFGEHHFTEQGFTQTAYKPALVRIRKYMRTDHNEKRQADTKAYKINPK